MEMQYGDSVRGATYLDMGEPAGSRSDKVMCRC